MSTKEENIINAPWNMAQIFYIELAKLIRFKDGCFIDGDTRGWKDGLKAVYRRIYFKLSASEREEFKKNFIEVEELFKILRRANNNDRSFLFEEIRDILDYIDTLIVEKMDKYKMIFPDIEIKSLDNYEKKMGLI